MRLSVLVLFLYSLYFAAAYHDLWILEQQNFYYRGEIKLVTTFNDSVPGPYIIAEEGDILEIDVNNIMITQATTVHWHGMDQRGTNFMDGVPDITECGIKPNSQFTYRFEAIPAGTHWYHSHSGAQYLDGHFGAMIIRAKDDPHKNEYDHDLDDHIIIFNDFFHEPGEELIINLINGGFTGGPVSDIPFQMAMINGYVGPFTPENEEEEKYSEKSPVQKFDPHDYPVFTVEKGKKYRFRVIDASSNMGFRFSIDDHPLKVLAISGGNIKPKILDSFVSFPGERFDFVLDADEAVGNYWIRLENAHGAEMRAILRYKGADKEYPTPADDCPPTSQCPRVKEFLERAKEIDTKQDFTGDCCNEGRWPEIDPCCLAGMGDFVPTVTTDIHSIEPVPFPTNADSQHVFRILGIMKPEFILHLNSIIFAFPRTPMVFSKGRYGLIKSDFKSELGRRSFLRSDFTDLIDLMGDLTVETHTKFVRKGEVVDIIFNNNGPMIHPFHLHGHRFFLLGASKPLTDPIPHEATSVDLFEQYDPDKHEQMLNFVDPPYVDSVPVPDHGWAYVRYVADNPGAWIFHCHLDPHLAAGMSVIFLEGSEGDDWPLPPTEFPVCGTNVGIGKVQNLQLKGRKLTWGEPEYGHADSFEIVVRKGRQMFHRSGKLDYDERSYTIPDDVDLRDGYKIVIRAKNVFGNKSSAAHRI